MRLFPLRPYYAPDLACPREEARELANVPDLDGEVHVRQAFTGVGIDLRYPAVPCGTLRVKGPGSD